MRKHISTTKRMRIFNAHQGICDICKIKIDHVAWDISHRRPLAMGGADDETNMFPIHRTCHRAETSEVDIPQIALAKRREAADIGAKAPSRHPISQPPKVESERTTKHRSHLSHFSRRGYVDIT